MWVEISLMPSFQIISAMKNAKFYFSKTLLCNLNGLSIINSFSMKLRSLE